MAAAIRLRDDFDARALRAIAKRAKDGPQARRLLALAAIYDGGARRMRPRSAGSGSRLSETGRCGSTPMALMASLIASRPAASLLKDEHRTALARMIEDGPMPCIHGVVRWRIVDLCQWVFDEFRIAVAEGRWVGNYGKWAIARSPPGRAITRNPRAPSRISKKLPTRLEEIAHGKGVAVDKIEVWFADEARIGQKTKITRRWAKRKRYAGATY